MARSKRQKEEVQAPSIKERLQAHVQRHFFSLDALREEQKTLPPGHVRRKEIDQKVDVEYEECRAVEKHLVQQLTPRTKRWLKAQHRLVHSRLSRHYRRHRKFGTHWPSTTAQQFADYLTTYLKLTPVLIVYEGCSPYASGQYRGGKRPQIEMAAYHQDSVGYTVLLHEIAHHIVADARLVRLCCGSHHGEFLWALRLVYEVLEEFASLQEEAENFT